MSLRRQIISEMTLNSSRNDLPIAILSEAEESSAVAGVLFSVATCSACASKGVAGPLYLAFIASRRLRRSSIRDSSSRGPDGGSVVPFSVFAFLAFAFLEAYISFALLQHSVR